MLKHHRCLLGLAALCLVATSSEMQGAAQRADGVSRRGATTTLLPDGSVLSAGGEGDPSLLAILDPQTGMVRSHGRLLAPRMWHTATVLPDGDVLIAGGSDTHGTLVTFVERIGLATLHATKLDAPVVPRVRGTATLLTSGQIFFTGGVSAERPAASEIWNPELNWTEAAPSPLHPRLDGVARLLPNGQVLLQGGTGFDGTPGAAELFDPDMNLFVPFVDVQSVSRGVPHVAAGYPTDGAASVPIDTRMTLRFSEPIDVRSASAELVVHTGDHNAPLPIRVVSAEGGMLAFVTAEHGLPAGVSIELIVANVRTAGGVAVERFSSRFSTALEPSSSAMDPGGYGEVDGADAAAARRALNSPWRKLPPLQAAEGVTGLAGQVLLLDGHPLADVTLEIQGTSVRTDRTGRFLLPLPTEGATWRELVIDGTSANRPNRTYGVFEVAVQTVRGRTAALPYTIWMPRLDTRNAVRITSPTTSEVVVTTPHIPGLELHIPARTSIVGRDGNPVTEVSITPIPIDRPPFPLPTGVDVPVYFTIQPGGAYAYTRAYGSGRKGPWLVYPNYRQKPPGELANFWHYDPEERGWYVYGTGRVTPNGRQVEPNASTTLYEFSGAMINYGQNPGPPGGQGPPGADPIDLGTGQFVVQKTDLELSDVMPLALKRTYRSGDNGQRPFGIGATHEYAMFLWSAHQYTEADLILPDGQRIHFVRTSSGTGFTDAVFEHASSPTAYHDSTLAWNGNGWDLTLKNGTVFVFGNEAPLQSIRDRFGNTISFTWSSTNGFGSGTGNLLRVSSQNGRYIELTYDTSNRITQAKDNINRTVGYEYDTAGRLWKVTDAKGGVTEYTYDIAHRMLTVEDPRGIVYVTNEYDTSGRVIEQTLGDGGLYQLAYTTNGSGQVTRTDVTNPRGYVRRVNFNADQYLTSEIRALGQAIEQTTTFTRLTGSNLVETVTDTLNRVTRFTYDTKGNVASVTRLYGTSGAVTTSYTYNSTHNLPESVTDPLNHTMSLAYGNQGAISTVTDAVSRQWTFGTNAAGQVTSTTTPLSKATTFSYDAGDLSAITTHLGNTKAIFTDAAGRVVRTTNPAGGTTRFEYDASNQVTKIIDPLGGETTFTYDGNSNLLTLTDPRGKTTTWTYDNMDRVVTRTDPLSRQESFTYDLNGNVASWTDRKGQVTTYSYDALDRQTFIGFGTTGNPATYASTVTTTFDAGNRPTQIVDSVGGTITRTYDLLDRLTEEVTPQGEIDFTFDAADRRATMTVAGQSTVSYSYDNSDRLTAVTQGTSTVSIGYDAAGRRSSITLPNGIVVEHTYDDDSRLAGLTYKLSGTTIGTLAYSYDANGWRTAMQGTFARSNLPAALGSATYDHANQIATWSGTTFSYDANGNLTSDGTRTYTWNERNQLTGISGGASAAFGYDGFGRRRTKTLSGTSTEFLYDGLNFVQEIVSATPSANLLSGLGVDEYFRRTDTSATSYYLTDALGSSIALSGTGGTLDTEYTYDPFGAVSTSGSSTANNLAFTGREADGTTLSYHRARYYSPLLMRFLSEDPLGYRGGDVNLFSYALQNPVHWTDPMGLSVKNNTDSVVYIKLENGCGTRAVKPGETWPDAQDGIAIPSIHPNKVYKTVNGVDVEITVKGMVNVPGWTDWGKQRAAEAMGKAGWLDAPPDPGWNNIFQQAKTPGRKDAPCPK